MCVSIVRGNCIRPGIYMIGIIYFLLLDYAVWFQEHGTRLVATLPDVVPTDFKSRLHMLLAKREQSDLVSN